MSLSEFQKWDDLGSNFFPLSNSLWALIPLEAWRRGLRVQLQPNARYSISDGRKTLHFRQTRLAGAEQDGIAKICDDKQATKNLLEKAKVPTPKGRYFSPPFDRKEILAYAEELGFPVCLKPNSWAKAKGVFPKVPDTITFRRLLDHLIDDLRCPELLVEEHVQGNNVRVFVAGDRVIAASSMSPANITGDGKHNIEELIDIKNHARKVNPHLGGCKIVVDEEVHETLSTLGLDLESIVKSGETVFLRKSANISKGGDSVDVTDRLSPKISQMAIDTIKGVRGLQHGGVDVLTLSPTDNSAVAMVNEINPSAGLGPHVYPGKGESINVPASIVDHYFPDSHVLENSSNWYFALSQVLRLFTSETAASVAIAPLPIIQNTIWRTVRVVIEENRQADARRKLISQIPKLGVHGHVARHEKDHFDVCMSGTGKSVEQALEIINRLGHRVKPVTKKPFRVSPGFRAL
ncbi:hypothetical protein [Glutamicibacter sp. HZAU]|uniref:hypothetical protein n=1 Tax=Glutamicibacter sp. HZAU TaxID=2049891 RepID=UPI000FFB65C4|nr:hypothetical protein [Glutamicibacter sp. HZAU]RWZ79539.1 hypothetical protein EKH49_16265 [Glutamicibacter sp. HZAU]